jgi:hypothetical protein
MKNQHLPRIILPLLMNALLSWSLIPYVIPAFEGYSVTQLFEVLLWQSMYMVGWPIAILGVILSYPFYTESVEASAFFILMYPVIQILLVVSIFSKAPRRGVLILLHVLIPLSFAVLWYYVHHGYDFMPG